jgi:DNA-binding MarR family transcriptional regulator
MGTAQLLECYCATMRQTARAVTQVYNLALRPAEIEITHYTLLALLHVNPGLTTGDLAGLLVMDQTTVTRTLRLMEKASLIAWQPGLDRRHKRWSLTQAGSAKLHAAQPLWQVAQATVRQQFGGGKLEELHQLSFALTTTLVS